jgi:Protein of unknown function (DUF2726)
MTPIRNWAGLTMTIAPSDPYDFSLLAAMVLLVVVGGLLLLRRSWRKDAPFPYRQIRFGTDLQQAWFPLLREAAEGEFAVLPAVRMEDLLAVDPVTRARAARQATERLAGQTADFLLLAPATLEPLAVVLLQSGTRPEAFRSAALLAGGLPVVPLAAQPPLAVAELRELLRRELGLSAAAANDFADGWVLGRLDAHLTENEEWSLGLAEPRQDASAAVTTGEARAADRWAPCPDCGAPRAPRQVNRGRHAGKYFLVCSQYPECQHLQPLGRRQS